MSKIRSGSPLIIDSHLHIGKVNNFYSNGATAEQLIYSMDLLGIHSGCVSHMYAIGPDIPKGNAEMASILSQYPGRFYGMLCINPHYQEEIEPQLHLYMDSGIFSQFKLHPFLHGVDSNDPGYDPIYEYANRKGTSILIHTWGVRDVQIFTSVAERYPNAIFIMGHSGGDTDAIEEAVKCAQRQPNIMLDITSSWNYDGAIEYMVSHVGAERVLFGSDAIFNSQSAALGRVLYARLSDTEKELILGLNIKRILEEGGVKMMNISG